MCNARDQHKLQRVMTPSSRDPRRTLARLARQPHIETRYA
jgi:hypothetical protein